MYIKNVEIKNLWGKFDINWELDKEINILGGENGMGKTTVLNLMYNVLAGNSKIANKYYFDSIKIVFDTAEEITLVATNNLLVEFANDPIIKTLANFNELAPAENEEDEEDAEIIANFSNFTKRIKKILTSEINTVEQSRRSSYIEHTIKDLKDIKQLKSIFYFSFVSTFDKIKDYEINYEAETELEADLFRAIEEFNIYELTLYKQEEKVTKQNEAKIKEILNKKNQSTTELQEIKNLYKQNEQFRIELYKNKNFLIKTINELFAQSGKKVGYDQDGYLIFYQDDTIIAPEYLSAGEKQLLIVLINSAIHANKPFIYLMDEPEISLHVDWQKKLIELIRKINKNAQIIIATHSPAIIMDGWLDKVTEMSDIKHKKR